MSGGLIFESRTRGNSERNGLLFQNQWQKNKEGVGSVENYPWIDVCANCLDQGKVLLQFKSVLIITTKKAVCGWSEEFKISVLKRKLRKSRKLVLLQKLSPTLFRSITDEGKHNFLKRGILSVFLVSYVEILVGITLNIYGGCLFTKIL